MTSVEFFLQTASKMAPKRKDRTMIDIADLVAEIDRYPDLAGIDADVWATMNYTQKVRLLIQRHLNETQKKIDELGKENG